ncbi:hypothetical protein O4J56_29105 [Nocardiopsis sp. RSe5-2]|uniref:Terpene synthase n=1 Tax=Nocardiopsis endophytica TaxID=3018445 RepID=A0ABT4UCQ8_9ACTN|nr:hypothetical protein [Nocardiopsis endophytica]MDA2814738.1 hypothetical protein [Nocardiopsis endophytica]
MHPYRIPPFYALYPARLNPHVEAAREHSRAWTEEMGIFDDTGPDGAPVWTRDKYEAHDFPLLAAYTHPDCDERLMKLAADWYVWVFYFDDHFLEMFKRTRDKEAAKAYLMGLRAYMPLDPGDGVPEAGAPVERSLADLWLRTAPGMSRAWRERFLGFTRNLTDESLRELVSIAKNEVANPIDYLQMRRRAGGAEWTAGLVEALLHAELPARVARTRPLRVITDAFADSAGMHNDVYSYQREVEEEGELDNGVLVMDTFLECGPQRAAEVMRDVVGSRMRLIENTAVTELPPLFAEHALDDAEKDRVLRYVKGLQEWFSGTDAWHLESGRYPGAASVAATDGLPVSKGTGTAAVRAAATVALGSRAFAAAHGPVQRTPAEPVDPPDFAMPYPARTSPHLDRVRAHAKAWAGAMGMLAPPVWDEAAFDAADYGLFAALTHPEAGAEELDLVADWHVWAFYLDDLFVQEFKLTRDRAGARAYLEGLEAFLPEDPAAAPAPADPAQRGLADLWRRTAPLLTPTARGSFPRVLADFTGSWLWELANDAQHRVPDPIDYIEMRRRTGGTLFSLELARLADGDGPGGPLPEDFLADDAVRSLNESWADVGPLRNDILSYRKEMEEEADVNNGVLVAQRFFGTSAQEAARILSAAADARLEEFERAAREDVPALCAEMGLGREATARVERYMNALRLWLAGDHAWSASTGRYRAPGSPGATGPVLRRLLGGPRGPGTAAARVPRPVPGPDHTLTRPRLDERCAP